MMKIRIKTISRRSISTILAILMVLSCLMVGTIITANAWGVKGGKRVYFVNTSGWSTVYQHFWGSGWNNYETMTQISGTGIYYKSYSNDYTADGFNFNSSQSTSGGTSARYDWVTSYVAYSGDNSMNYETDLTKLNGTAKVKSMISTGGNYTNTNNSNCVATISSINLGQGVTDATATSGSTGSSDTAECYPAYGASVSYSATASGDYVFMGFSTTNSTSLPNDATTSFSNRTSVGFNGGGNLSDVYAYFMKKNAVTTVGGSYGTLSASPTKAIKGASVTLSAAVTNSNYNFNGVDITKTSDGSAVTSIAASSFSNTTSGGTYSYTMPGYAVTATSKYTIKTGTVSVSKDAGVDSYTITAGGSAISSGDTVNAGTAIVITPTYKTGYEPASTSYSITGTVTGASATSAGVLSFTTSSGSNVTASLASKKIDYAVSKNSPSNGTVAVSKSPANYQDTITVTLTPSSTYKVGTITVEDASNNSISTVLTQGGGVGEETKYTFTMPASAVSVTVTFIYGYQTYTGVHASYSISGSDPGTISVTPTAGASIRADIGQSITATAAPTGYTFNGWTSTDGTFADDTALNTTFYPTANNATAVATYTENDYTITVSAGNGGSVTVNQFTAHPVTTYALSSIGAVANTGYYFSGWTKGTGVTLTGNSSTNPNAGTLTATTNSTLQANFTAYSHPISYGGVNTSYTATINSGVLNDVIRFYVKANQGYSLGTPTVTRNGSGITVTKDSSDTTHSGYTCYYFTVPAVSDETPITVTTNATAITPTISVAYQNGASSTTTATSGSATTTARGNKTITFTNPSSYPNGTVFHIYDGSTSIYNSTVGGTYAKTTTLSAGTHTLKVVVTLDNAQINSATVTLTVNAYHTVTVKSPTYGGRVTINYVGDWSSNSTTTDSSPTAGQTNTVYVKDGTNATVVRYSGSTNELANVYVDGVAQTVTSNSATISSITADHAITADFYSSNWGLRGEDSSVGLNWNSSLKFRYTETENVLQATLTYSSASNTAKKFKVYDSSQSGDSAWYTNKDLNATADVSDIQFTNTVSGTDTNAKYTPSVKGTYTFKFNSSTNKFSLEYPGLGISLGAHNNATVADLPSDAKAGDEISFTANPSTGYVITGITYTTNAAGSETENATFDVHGGTASFTMPNVDTTVVVTTKAAYTVTFTKGSNVESLSAVYTAYSDNLSSGEYVGNGDTVTFSAVLAEGYSVNASSLPSGYSGYSETLNSSNKYEVSFTKTISSANLNIDLSATPINYILSTAKANNVNGGSVEFRKNTNTTKYTQRTDMTVEDTFTPVITPDTANGFELGSLTLSRTGSTSNNLTNSGTAASPSFSATAMPAYNSTITATWAAIQPSISTINSSAITGNAYSISVSAGQSITLTPSTGTSYESKVTYAKGGNNSGLVNVSNKVFTFNTPSDLGTDPDAHPSYTFTITPTNTPATGISKAGTSITVTVNVTYSTVQKAYLKLYNTYTKYNGYDISAADTESGDVASPASPYHTYDSCLSTAGTAVSNKNSDSTYMILYGQTNPSAQSYDDKRTALETAYTNLDFKQNTFYVLTKYSADVKINALNYSGWFTDKNTSNRVNSSPTDFTMTYEGKTKNSSNSEKWLWSFTYYGKSQFRVYYKESTNTYSSSYKISGTIDLSTSDCDYGEYYADLQNNSYGSGTTTIKSTWTDYTLNDNTINDLFERGKTYTFSDLISNSRLGITTTGSLVITSNQKQTQTFTITGPEDSENPTTVTITSSDSWTPSVSGQYSAVFNSSIGTDAAGRTTLGATFSRVGEYSLYVAYDEIEIYADMNGNIGTPTLHIPYTDTTTNEASDLPCEFDMVSGSESIYSYTLNLPNLKANYGLDLIDDGYLSVSKISIDAEDVDNSAFEISKAAARMGTLWLKADSTHMNTFNKIAYGSTTRRFRAVIRDGNGDDTAYLNPFANVNGTGIINDDYALTAESENKTGNGSATSFTLTKGDLVTEITGITDNSTERTDYTFNSSTGTVTFDTAPVSGHTLVISYKYKSSYDYSVFYGAKETTNETTIRSGDGTEKTFSLANSGFINAITSVKVGGVAKTQGTDYTFNQNARTITFTTAPASASNNIVINFTYTFNFSYNLKAKALSDITSGDSHYYFDHWELAGDNNHETVDESSGTDVNLNRCPEYSDGNVTYIAVYKLIDDTTTTARCEITYHFKDFDTSDGNYEFDASKTLKNETYTKTVKVNSAINTDALAETKARENAPQIMSNYFDYVFDTAEFTDYDSTTNKYKVDAYYEDPIEEDHIHEYKIVVVDTNNQQHIETGYYQQPLELKASDYSYNGDYHWSIYEGETERVLASNENYTARFVTSNDVNNSVQTIYLETGTASVNTDPNAAIMHSCSITYYDNDTEKAKHNFYIIDTFNTSYGEFIGGGVVYATTDEFGNYRQANARTVFASSNNIRTYVNNILDGVYTNEYTAQTINNVGFRYLPYSKGTDVFRYSDEIKAYIYTFAGTNNNSLSLEGQKLRVFSYFVYKDTNDEYHTVVSSTYAQAERYIYTEPQS